MNCAGPKQVSVVTPLGFLPRDLPMIRPIMRVVYHMTVSRNSPDDIARRPGLVLFVMDQESRAAQPLSSRLHSPRDLVDHMVHKGIHLSERYAPLHIY